MLHFGSGHMFSTFAACKRKNVIQVYLQLSAPTAMLGSINHKLRECDLTNIINATARLSFIAEQMDRIRASTDSLDAVRRTVRARIEKTTSLRLSRRDRAALRSYIRDVTALFCDGRVDEHTAAAGLNRILMAAAANSPSIMYYGSMV
ncbi:hypothetical protein [Asticcacaulis solisilvae]|uniref:hypothetical protein n=1 Tax=Asticcacaulis solisilvae TaxID=1217274 RepID=UPI003FD85DD3